MWWIDMTMISATRFSVCSVTDNSFMMSAFELFKDMVDAQRLRAPDYKNGPTFLRNLEAQLDRRRKDERLYVLKKPRKVHDFSSNDFLSLSSSGLLRMAFFDELAKHPDFQAGATGSRLLDGNSSYINTLEQDIAAFHGAETGLIFQSGYDANVSIFEVIPQAGDAIVFDELVHASIHDGLKHSKARTKRPFFHNDLVSYQSVLKDIRETHDEIRKGERTLLVSVETVYSMDGTICSLREMVNIADDLFPAGNCEFIVDEAHATGLIGKNGRGLVSNLGLEKRIAIRLHTFGKGLGASGCQLPSTLFSCMLYTNQGPAIVVGSETVRTMLLNYAHALIYSTAPSFVFLATVKAAYSLLQSDLVNEVSFPNPFFQPVGTLATQRH
jgi:8-amino-7-oxononanoate synthase